ncbi:transposase [Cucumis melo var. makuwa]|uniref:Transposase n=1 Tax=Cucumis melo var. makuwa TaxID=1194695 RepID=A0A5A7VJH5_CUCMM|nr:transposase [Cucumis melo var. makuwa]TYK21786.1 transposase [Cucumis melo var. makuwa]
MQEDVVVTLCLLEKYFPSSFFTVMVEVKSGFKKSIIAHSIGGCPQVALALEVPKNSITPSLTWIAQGPSPDCDWVDNRSGVKVDELGFTIVDLKRIGHKSDSFILATQAKQVFYVQDSSNPEWSVVLTSPQRTIEEDFFEGEIGDMLQECGYGTIQRMPNVDTPNETDNKTSTYIRHDCEGRWVEKDS